MYIRGHKKPLIGYTAGGRSNSEHAIGSTVDLYGTFNCGRYAYYMFIKNVLHEIYSPSIKSKICKASCNKSTPFLTTSTCNQDLR